MPTTGWRTPPGIIPRQGCWYKPSQLGGGFPYGPSPDRVSVSGPYRPSHTPHVLAALAPSKCRARQLRTSCLQICLGTENRRPRTLRAQIASTSEHMSATQQAWMRKQSSEPPGFEPLDRDISSHIQWIEPYEGDGFEPRQHTGRYSALYPNPPPPHLACVWQ